MPAWALGLLALAFLAGTAAVALAFTRHHPTEQENPVASRTAAAPPAPAPLVLDQLIQVLDSNGTWHAATVGVGVLCSTNRDAAHAQNAGETFDPTTTVQWDYGVDHVDCPETACWSAVGRR